MKAKAISTAERLVVAAHFLTRSRQGASAVSRSDLSDLWQYHKYFSFAQFSAAQGHGKQSNRRCVSELSTPP
jgi:hypothetical protein